MAFLRFQINSTSRNEDVFVVVFSLALAIAILYAGRVLVHSLPQPLLDLHSFRQTQTALTVYWMVHGGPWLAYETPVLGAPWSIPFEFPIYQWAVSLLAAAGIPIDAAGRIISFAFYVATLWPLAVLFRAVGLNRIAFLSTSILFMTAPLYLYWSRAFLVESCALFFSCLALALLASFLRDREPLVAFAATIAGLIATLAKATTFPAFAVLGGCLILLDLGARFRTTPLQVLLKQVVIAGLIITLPMVIGYAWVYYSDQVKLANDFGTLLTSANLAAWTFGSLQQRFSTTLWKATIENRVLPDLFGYTMLLAFVIAGTALTRARYALGALLAVIGFLVPFLVFTNLHIIHNYYQYANGIFALAAVGIGLGSLVEGRQRYQYIIAAFVLTALVVGQIGYFRVTFLPIVERDYSQDQFYRIAQLAKELTPSGDSILVFGDDWSSVVPYYADRKGLVVPGWTPTTLIDKIIINPQAFLGDQPLGAIVSCRDGLATYKNNATAIEQFVAKHAIIREFGGCQLLAPGQK